MRLLIVRIIRSDLPFCCEDDDMIEKILSESPCLESLELKNCYGYRRIDVTSKSVKKLVFFKYNSYREISTYEEAYIDCVKINDPYISSLTITGELVLRELVLLDVSSLINVELDYSIDWELGYSIDWRKSGILDEEVFGGFLESLGHVEDITFGDDWSELLSRLKAGSDTSNDDLAENGDREEQIASSDYVFVDSLKQLMLAKKLLTLHRASPIAEIELCFFGKLDAQQTTPFLLSSPRKSGAGINDFSSLKFTYKEREAQRQLTGSIDGWWSQNYFIS
nr:hypothetical protein [Tanacetum cinerariifolium]